MANETTKSANSNSQISAHGKFGDQLEMWGKIVASLFPIIGVFMLFYAMGRKYTADSILTTGDLTAIAFDMIFSGLLLGVLLMVAGKIIILLDKIAGK